MARVDSNEQVEIPDATNRAGRWWLEREALLLVLIVAALYLVRLDALSIRGEESRRARIGIEMLESGDWIVPRQQGEPFLSRPPLQNWVIVGLGQVLGGIDVWAIRLPSVISLLGVVLLIYGYSRTFLSRFGSFTGAVAFASMTQVMELGRLGETEMMFTLLVAGSLLVWHWGFSRGWSGPAIWLPAYFLVALGTLAKGPQAPAYFAASVGLFLLVSRRWRFALSWSHLAGILTLLVVWGAWQVPFAMELGYDGTRAVYGQDVEFRFVDTRWITIVKHIVEFPLEVFLGCMLPWSLLLLPYINPGFRRTIGFHKGGSLHVGSARGHVLFLACAIGITFPTVWLVPGGHTRYFVPIYPCFAPLIGLVVDRCLASQAAMLASPSNRWWRLPWELWWRNWLALLAVAMPVFGLLILAVSLLEPLSDSPSDSLSEGGVSLFAQPLGFAAVYLAASVALGVVAFGSRLAKSESGRLAGPVAVALFVGLTFVGVFTNSLQRRSETTAEQVAAVKRQLPADAGLVSLGYTHHLFAYYYGEAIPLVYIPATDRSPGPEVRYFCFLHRLVNPSQLGFEYETIAVVSCARFREKETDNVVTVARRAGDR